MELVNAWRYRPCQYRGQCKPRSQRDVIPPVQASRTLLAWSALLVWFSVTWGLFLGGLACWAFAGPLVCLSPNIFSPKAQVVPPLSLPVAGGRSPSLRQIPPLYPHFRCLPSALLPGLSLANEAVRTSSNRKSACTILQAHGDLKAGYL